MRFRIETSLDWEYGIIEKQYGDVLRKYGLSESDNSAYIVINSMEELLSLEEDIGRFSGENVLDEFVCYHGIMITKGIEGNEQFIEINDSTD